MKTPPNLAILPSLFCVFLTLSVFVPTTQALPVWQDESTELEKMILKQVEERKKEIEAQKAADAKAGINASPANSAGSRPVNPPASFGNQSGALAPGTNATTTASPSGVQFVPVDSATIPEESPGGIPRAERELGDPEFTEPTQMTGSRNSEIDPNIRIRFNFVDEEWKDVIEWFAEQVGFGVYFGRTVPPQGTFSYFDSSERSVIEALDFINSRLSILQPPHVLVRNGNQLVLVNESEPYPHQLIAAVTPDELPEFGKFEVVSCEFDLGKLTTGNQLALELREDVNPVHIDGFAYIASANRLIIREKVYVLERFKDIVDFALRQVDSVAVDTYQAQHVEPEVLLITLRPMMGFVDESNSLQDGSLSFSVQPFGDTIYLKGTPAQIDVFKKTAAMMDVPPAEGSGLLEQPYFQTYRIAGGDPEVIFQILQSMLDGEPNVKMEQDSANGNIYLEAPKRIHDSVSDFLSNMTPGSNFDIIKLQNLDPDDAVSQIEELLGLDGFEEAKTGPKLIANTDTDSINVYGTPQELTLVRQIVERIDSEAVTGDGIRRPVILIPMSPRRQEDVMNLMQIPGIMDSIGRKNRLNLILPEDREKFRNRIRFDRTGSQPMESLDGQGSETPESTPQNRIPESRSPVRSGSERPKPDRTPGLGNTLQVSSQKYFYATAPFPQQDDLAGSEQLAKLQESGEIGQTTDEQLGQSPGPKPGYQPAVEEPSIPNAPIEIRMTDKGIVITTQDLDAGVDLEAMIKDYVDTDSEDQLPSFFYLQFRKVEEAKSILEHVLGLKSSSDGGGGGIGGLLGGAVQNAVGGAAGDALGGLFGGGGDSGLGDDSAGALELEGENVRLGTDVRFNTLIVTGATDNDVDVITQLIDYVDQPGPPQNPKLQGLTYEIKVFYRDPNELKELIMSQLPDYFKKQGSATANPQDAQQQLQAQVANQIRESLQGGGRGQRGGSSNSEAEQPKATLGVDEVNRKLLVTGPQFIYEAVYQLVEILDVESNVRPYQLDPGPFSTAAMKGMLKNAFGDKAIISEDEEGSQPDNGNNSNRGSSPVRQPGNGPSRPASNNAQSLQEAIMNAAQRGRGGGGNFQFQGGRGGFGGQGGGFGGQSGQGIFGGQGFPGGGR